LLSGPALGADYSVDFGVETSAKPMPDYPFPLPILDSPTNSSLGEMIGLRVFFRAFAPNDLPGSATAARLN